MDACPQLDAAHRAEARMPIEIYAPSVHSGIGAALKTSYAVPRLPTELAALITRLR